MSAGRYETPTLSANQTTQYRRVDGAGATVVTGTVSSSGTATVSGPAADGAAVSGNPVRIAGKDGSGNTQDIITTTAGVVLSEPQGTGMNVAASTYYNAAVSADVDAAVAAGAGTRLMGFSCRETAGAVAVFKIVNGATGAGANKVQVVALAANESTGDWFGPQGIACASGISVDWVSGALEITLNYVVVA